MLLAGLGQLHSDELVSLGFEALDDFSNKATLDAIRLDLEVMKESSVSMCYRLRQIRYQIKEKKVKACVGTHFHF